MKKSWRKTFAAVLAVAMLLVVTVFATEAVTAKKITALLDPTITIKYNGRVKTFVDANGNAVQPVAYNGTVYLPVRGISALFGLPVEWDGQNRTVLLGERNGVTVDETIWKTDADYFCSTQYTKDPTELVVDSISYPAGIVCRRFDEASKGGKAGMFTLDKKYTTLSLTAVCADGLSGTLKFYEGDVVYKTIDLSHNDPANVSFGVAGVQELTMSWEGNEKGATATIVNMVLS